MKPNQKLDDAQPLQFSLAVTLINGRKTWAWRGTDKKFYSPMMHDLEEATNYPLKHGFIEASAHQKTA